MGRESLRRPEGSSSIVTNRSNHFFQNLHVWKRASAISVKLEALQGATAPIESVLARQVAL
jgi:hypothetical protein